MDFGLGELTLLGAFTLGLAHTLEPCEDKAVVSLYTLWGSTRWREGILLVVLYGLGMTLIDTTLGFTFSFLGVTLLEKSRDILQTVAGSITVAFGFFMLTGWSPIHMIHHHNGAARERLEVPERFGRSAALFFGLVRGLPPCPFELAVFLWAASVGNILLGTLTVFVFGMGTTVGLIPLGFVMGGLANAAKRTKYGTWIPKICGLTLVAIGILLIVSSFFGIEF